MRELAVTAVPVLGGGVVCAAAAYQVGAARERDYGSRGLRYFLLLLLPYPAGLDAQTAEQDPYGEEDDGPRVARLDLIVLVLTVDLQTEKVLEESHHDDSSRPEYRHETGDARLILVRHHTTCDDDKYEISVEKEGDEERGEDAKEGDTR
ncbi:hypothetical protein PFISCL1PPCAC_16575 [Pristionchus fissidentatus]|uniref:Uncharacterized protein n=1 Tax=Pristionchus fissidentatus TaxID=1538716 RepID=A0AAV5W112_9BILA|nr:hypothetical protein PFISCL1PPCAC_16575 [Pristionchus fissidentatus]